MTEVFGVRVKPLFHPAFCFSEKLAQEPQFRSGDEPRTTGMWLDQILSGYPGWEAADLRAAIAYAARLSRSKSIEPVAA